MNHMRDSADKRYQQLLDRLMKDSAVHEHSPYQQMIEGGHTVAIFKNGKLIAADADVFVRTQKERPIIDYHDKRQYRRPWIARAWSELGYTIGYWWLRAVKRWR